jgi:hypothetical protein
VLCRPRLVMCGPIGLLAISIPCAGDAALAAIVPGFCGEDERPG